MRFPPGTVAPTALDGQDGHRGGASPRVKVQEASLPTAEAGSDKWTQWFMSFLWGFTFKSVFLKTGQLFFQVF